MENEQIREPQAPVMGQPAGQPWTQGNPVYQPDPRAVEIQKHTKRFRHGRSSLLVLLILSAVNMVLMAVDLVGAYWPYSISMPYELLYFVKAIENDFVDGPWENGPLACVMLVLGFLVLAVYLLCWIFSKKKGGWLMASAVLYTVDSVALVIYVFLVMESALPYLLDYGFHVLALVELYMGAVAQKKLSALQPPAPQFVQPYQVQYQGTCDPEKF